MERTFNYDSSNRNIEHSKFISMTENHISKKKNIISNYVPRAKQHPMIAGLEKKRMSTEQLIEVSPGSWSPDNITDKSDSFKSSSTVLHSPGNYKVSEQRTTEKNNSSSKKDFECHEVEIVIRYASLFNYLYLALKSKADFIYKAYTVKTWK